ncbi:MAG: hypothetical protein IKR58_01205 [Lachnospiraceae bacterium]|nr:hypothetical protein [Lachnospiraceae bacterium]
MKAGGLSRIKFILIIAALLLIILAGAFWYVTTEYKVTEMAVEGNIHYTSQEVANMVLPGGIRNNSLYLKLWYRNRQMPDIPFVETMDVEILSHHKIQVTVYEKALAGCFEYLGKYMYFDKDGIVVESSSKLTEGVPQIKGLSFDHVVLFEQLPVDNEDIFSEILKVTQLLDKYELKADQIYFSTIGEVTLYFDQVRVTMGGEDYIDEKVMELIEILPNLEGMSGILHMESYTPETTKVTFVPDDINAVAKKAAESAAPSDSAGSGAGTNSESSSGASNTATTSTSNTETTTENSSKKNSNTAAGNDTSGTNASAGGEGTAAGSGNTGGTNASTTADQAGTGDSNTTNTGNATNTAASDTGAATGGAGSVQTDTGNASATVNDDGIIEISVID